MWEYKVVFGINERMPKQESRLNELGKEGWELVSVMTGSVLGINIHKEHTFKRRIKQ